MNEVERLLSVTFYDLFLTSFVGFSIFIFIAYFFNKVMKSLMRPDLKKRRNKRWS